MVSVGGSTGGLGRGECSSKEDFIPGPAYLSGVVSDGESTDVSLDLPVSEAADFSDDVSEASELDPVSSITLVSPAESASSARSLSGLSTGADASEDTGKFGAVYKVSGF